LSSFNLFKHTALFYETRNLLRSDQNWTWFPEIKMKTASVLAFSVVLFVALFLTSPKASNAALLDDLLISAEKATAFFPGAQAMPTGNEEMGEAEEPKTAAEIAENEREATKSPTEVAAEAEEAVRETAEETHQK